MRLPMTRLSGNLMWTRNGAVWATWKITPQRYGLRPLKDKQDVATHHRALLRALGGEALMMGLAVTEDPIAVIQRQIKDVDLERCPRWHAEAVATQDVLEEMELGDRTMWLSVPLKGHWADAFRAGFEEFRSGLGLPTTPPADGQVQRAREAARRVADLLPPAFKPVPAHPAEQVWIYAHAQCRGMIEGMPSDDLGRSMWVSKTGAAVPEPHLDEGARADTQKKVSVDALTSRVLKVTDPHAADLGQPPSYQCLMAVKDTPPGGMTFPGAEMLTIPDQVGIDADWAIRLRCNSRESVIRKNRNAMRNITDQRHQREDDMARGADDVDSAENSLVEYRRLLAEDRLETEIEHVIMVAVGDLDPEVAQDKARTLVQAFNESDIKLERPIGGQEALWWAMLPGNAMPKIARGYRQITTSADLGMVVPYICSDLGGAKGSVFALNTATARRKVVHQDLGGAPELDKSGSIAFVGELGAGKSFAMKKCALDLMDTGGQMFVIDKSADGEWARMAQAVEDNIVVDPETPRWSMDPLAVFSGDLAAEMCGSFLATLLGCTPRSEEGRLLSEATTEEYLRTHDIDRLADLVDHFEGIPGEVAAKVAASLRTFAGHRSGRVLFDRSLPPVDGTVSAVVWRTHTMRLPSNEEITQAHLFETMDPTKVLSRAYYQLLTATARHFSFADRSRPAAFVIDEAYDVCSNRENLVHIEHTVRQGRRPKALAFLGSHNPDTDFGDGSLGALIPTRVAMRHQDEDLARASIRFLGFKEDDPQFNDLVESLRFDTSPVEGDAGVRFSRRGEGYMRDLFGAVGPIKVLAPALPERAELLGTTPPKAVASL